MLLFVTDSTLQNAVHGIPKVVAVSVTASCVLSMEIIEALSAGSRLVFFKDALWGNGKLCTWFGSSWSPTETAPLSLTPQCVTSREVTFIIR